MSERDYVVYARQYLDRDEVQSIVKAENLQDAVRKSAKLVPPQAGYHKLTIEEVVGSNA